METDRASEANLCLFRNLSISVSAKVASGPVWDAVARGGAQWALGQQLLNGQLRNSYSTQRFPLFFQSGTVHALSYPYFLHLGPDLFTCTQNRTPPA
jgi:hypothetical protein